MDLRWVLLLLLRVDLLWLALVMVGNGLALVRICSRIRGCIKGEVALISEAGYLVGMVS